MKDVNEGDLVEVIFTQMGGGKDREQLRVTEITDRYVTLEFDDKVGGFEYELNTGNLFGTHPTKGKEDKIGYQVQFRRIE